jgi:hypothetical protein
MRFENRRGPKIFKKEKKSFVSWKTYFFSYYLFIAPFFLHFKDDFKILT